MWSLSASFVTGKAGRWPESGGGRYIEVKLCENTLVVAGSGRYREVAAIERWSLEQVRLYIMEELVCIMEPAIIFQKIMILVTMNIQGLACFGVESPNIIQILKVG